MRGTRLRRGMCFPGSTKTLLRRNGSETPRWEIVAMIFQCQEEREQLRTTAMIMMATTMRMMRMMKMLVMMMMILMMMIVD